jgi:hypothetical protein
VVKYHLNRAGEAGRCSATRGNCPFGDASEHYDSQQAAAQAYEVAMAPSTHASTSKIVLDGNLGSFEVVDGDLSASAARMALSTGLCGDLALAIHRKIGATPYFLSMTELTETELAEAFATEPNSIVNISSHVLVESPTVPGSFIDSYGQQDEESLRDFWEQAAVVKGTPAMLEHFANAESADRLGKFAEAALELDRAGESYSYDELDEYSDDWDDDDEDDEDELEDDES